jgi:hypothetical protein
MDWIGSWFGRKPERAQALAGINDFLQAVRLEHCQLDQQMVNALNPGRNHESGNSTP